MTRPIFEITTTHVISFGIKVSEADAEEWLKLWADTISLEMKDIVTPQLKKMFHRATLRDYPGRAFDRFLNKVDRAIYAAEHEYSEKIGLSQSGDCMTVRDLRGMVAYLMGTGSGKREAICYQTITMKAPDCRKEALRTSEEHPILVIAEGDKVRARVLEDNRQLRKKILVFGAPNKTPKPAHSKVPPKTTRTTVH